MTGDKGIASDEELMDRAIDPAAARSQTSAGLCVFYC